MSLTKPRATFPCSLTCGLSSRNLPLSLHTLHVRGGVAIGILRLVSWRSGSRRRGLSWGTLTGLGSAVGLLRPSLPSSLFGDLEAERPPWLPRWPLSFSSLRFPHSGVKGGLRKAMVGIADTGWRYGGPKGTAAHEQGPVRAEG